MLLKNCKKHEKFQTFIHNTNKLSKTLSKKKEKDVSILNPKK